MIRSLAALAVLAIATPLAAAEPALPTAADLAAIAARIPDQPWYPQGYYDIKIAAEADRSERDAAARARMLAEYGPADDEPLDGVAGDDPGHDLIDCSSEDLSGGIESNQADDERVWLADQIAHFRAELVRLGYPSALFEEPLLAYEKARLEQIALVAAGGELPVLPYRHEEYGLMEEVSADTIAQYEFVRLVNANRLRSNPQLKKVMVEGGCGAAGDPIIVRTAPANGQVWLISAFGFKVCTRKLANPWDKLACRWNEIETGAENYFEGRYVYEVRWPDGTVRRGARDIFPDYEVEGPKTVTFRKTGS